MRRISLTLALLLAALTVHGARAQDYPNKPIRLIVPFPPGASTDISARILAEALGPKLGQPVVVENRAGAGGLTGIDFVAKSPADGYTLVLGANGVFVVQPAFVDDLEYRPLRDFVFTSPISLMPGVLVVHPSLPVRTVKDVVQKLREALNVTLDQPRVRQTFEKSGGQLYKSTPEEFVRRMEEEHARWARIRRETGIRVE